MAYAVVLYFDPATEANVRALWNQISEAGISSVTATMGIRPHISLASFERLVPDSFCQEIDAFAKSVAPVTVALSAVGVFPTSQGVVYLAPVTTARLVNLHETFHSRLVDLGLASAEYYRPGKWMPHCTVAINLPSERVGAAVAICLASNVFQQAQLSEIALVEYMPIAEICGFRLG